MAAVMRVAIARKTFRGRATPVLADIAFDLEPGRLCALVGPSGSGKTTLLSILAGLDRDFEGQVAARPAPVGYAFQTPRLLPWLTSRDNLSLVLGGADAADRWLAAVGLSEAAAVTANRLSAGMAQRVSLARALGVGPRLLLLDEPFSALDAATAEAMRGLLIASLARDRPVAMLVTHDVEEALALAHRVLVIGGSPARITLDLSLDGPARREAAAALHVAIAARPPAPAPEVAS